MRQSVSRRMIVLVATLGLVTAGAGATPAAAGPDAGQDMGNAAGNAATARVRVLALNDFHGNLEPPTGSSGRGVDESGATVAAGGAAFVAAHLNRLRDDDTLVVASGDLIGATPLISAAYHDEPSVEFLGRVGVTASAVGNHEFDEGYRELLRIQYGGCHPVDGCSPAGEWDGAGYTYLAANVLRERTGLPILPPVTVRTVNGVRVGFIGVVTRTTPTIVTSEGIQGLEFADEVESANRAARLLRLLGVRAMVLLVHEGDQVGAGQRPDDCGVVAGAGSRIAAQADADIDVVLAGHTHQQYVCRVSDPAGRPRLYTEGSSFGRVITEVGFDVDRRTGDVVRDSLAADNHVVTRDIAPDPEISAFVEEWRQRVAPVANRRVGTITADITRTPAASGETPLGNLIADAQLADTAAGGGARIALMNPGGIRTDLPFAQSGGEGDGVVTYGELFSVQPFNNLMGVVTLTGAELDALLEQQWQPQPDGSLITRILQPSATLHYTMDRTAPIGSRISGIEIDGVPVDPAGTYRVAANNFLLGGGDGFSVFTQGDDLWNGSLDIDALVNHVSANSPVAPPATGRITVAG